MGGLEDEINYRLLGFPLDVSAEMGAGVDTFTLFTNVNTLSIDFGNDIGDEFVNEWGFFGFDADYTNYHWFDFIYTEGDDTMIVTQLIDTGDIIIDNNGGPATGIDWQVLTALGGVAPTNHAETLIVNMLDNTGNKVTLDLDNPVIAFLTLNLGDGDRVVEFTGESNNPLRDLNINADLGNQHIELSVNAALAVATLNIDLGMGYDSVDDDANNLTLSEDLIFRGVNLFENDGFLSVGRNVLIDSLAEMEENIFASNGQMFVAGTFTYDGGTGRDELRLNGAGGTTLSMSTFIDLGQNLFGGTQYALLNHPSTFLGGPLTVLSDSEASPDVFETHPGGSFTGNILVDLAGGTNTAVITGNFSGSSISYTGGAGEDHVTFGTTGNPANFNATLGQGNDTFTLLAGASIASPFIVNFGDNADTFINHYGPFDFNAELLGLNGFNHLFDLNENKLSSLQISDQGPVTVDNNGTAGAIRFIALSTGEIAVADHLEIEMLGGSLSSLDLDFDNPFAGNVDLLLNSGHRDVNFSGDSNSIGGNLSITGGSGDHTVGLAVNAPLQVGGEASISLGLDVDSLTDNGSGAVIGGNLLVSGINTFTVGGVLTVGGNLSFASGTDNAGTMLDEGGALNIAGDFAYLGSSQNDLLSLATGSASIGGDINVSLGNGNNTAIMAGTFGGNSVSYSGGTGVDFFQFSMTGSPATIFASMDGDNDTFGLGAGVTVDSLTIDFGSGDDAFLNAYGPFDFPATLLGLDGFNHFYNPLSGSLTSTQVVATGPVIADNNGAGGAVRVITGTTTQLGPVDHLEINMLNGSGDDLTIDLDSPLAGDLTAGLGGGARSLFLTGSSNVIGGDLEVTGGSGPQTVHAAVNQALAVGAQATVNLGSGPDIVDLAGNNLAVAGNLSLLGVNQFDSGGIVTVGGNLVADSSMENESSTLIDNAIMDIAGDLMFYSGDGDDTVLLTAATSVGGDIHVKAGAGNNQAVILGTFGGSDIKYTGGSGVDRVTLGTTGSPANVNAKLGLGDDQFVLNPGTAVATSFLRVDFGGGDDTFNSQYGVFDFNARLLNLDGYHAIYDLATGNLDITQVADTGNVVVDSNGASQAVRFGVGTMNEVTPANDLRLILQAGSSTNVTADFDAPRTGNTILQLRSGDRQVNFTGDSNTFNGLLRVEAADGVQAVFLADNAPLTLDGTLVVNGRDGSDRIVAENALNITGAMLLRGVNTFVNDAGVNVGGDFNMITLLEDEDTKLISNASFVVGGNLSYLGGGGVDAINFKSTGASIGGFTYIDIATSSDASNNQRILLTGGFSTTNLVVDGGNAAAGNFFTTDAATVVDNEVVVNFAGSASNNTAIFNGSYGGGYGTYRGGVAGDLVVMGANAPNMLFAALTGEGNDTFTIAPTALLDFLYVDFGPGIDFLDNQLGDPLPFPSNIFNN
jgi:hypothetical protein